MNVLERLAKDTKARETLAARRDPLIVEARKGGATWPEIATAAGLTELATRNAARRANGGELP